MPTAFVFAVNNSIDILTKDISQFSFKFYIIKEQIRWFSISNLEILPATNMKYLLSLRMYLSKIFGLRNWSSYSIHDLTTSLIYHLPWITFSVPCIFTASINLVFNCRKTNLIIFCEWFLLHLDNWYRRKSDFRNVVTNSYMLNR